MLMQYKVDRRVATSHVANKRVQNILRNEQGMTKVSACCVSTHLLPWLQCMTEALKSSEHPPDSEPPGFPLLLNLKKELSGWHYANDNDIISAVDDFLHHQEKAFYICGIQALQHHWQQCLHLEEYYVEK
ncbi:uncharacterized protein LOC121389197 [Gigantopelta aegis]|uniref:uncharacterized protein LOC121389197 n=1 Tax=Gigantopelta aegis TaxID=1735272 RepID=UPI001B88BBB7|nr:uncharacterized protein LOC121389197 [Gigantopelta aegis]